MSDRKIVGEWLRNYLGGGNDRTAEAGAIIAELRKHGFRVLAPGELDPATVERCAIAGWNACRKSIYAVCEDVEAEADRILISSTVGTASEEQHAKGYHAGTCRAARSIARGFNSMEALDDDNLTKAIRTLTGGNNGR